MVDGIMPTGGSQHLLKRNIYGRTGGYDACGQLSRQLTSPIKSLQVSSREETSTNQEQIMMIFSCWEKIEHLKT